MCDSTGIKLWARAQWSVTTAASILFEELLFRADSIRGRIVFEGGQYSRADSIQGWGFIDFGVNICEGYNGGGLYSRAGSDFLLHFWLACNFSVKVCFERKFGHCHNGKFGCLAYMCDLHKETCCLKVRLQRGN